MASIGQEKSGKYYARIRFDEKELKLRGFTNKREAERFGQKLDELRASKKTGSLPPELRVWVNKLEQETPEVYDKLAGVGLLPERQKKHTLGKLLEAFRKRGDVVEESKEVWDKVTKNLLAFFSENKTIEAITQEDAVRFERWIRETPLNTRVQPPQPYSQATVNKRIGHVKTVFTYAEKLGWLSVNPFRFLKSGDTTNPGKLEYVDLERFWKVLEVAPLYWKLILMFGRFCGVRGSSELYRMEWEDIHLSSAEEKGWVAIRACKNVRHGRTFRVVPLPPVMEPVLIEWMEQAEEKETLLFPGMGKKTNFSVMTEKLARRAGVNPWVNPWYNLRKSFCTDLIQVVKDIPTYEQITDHGYQISVKHYQIMTGGRLARGMEAVQSVWEQLEQASPKTSLQVSQKGAPQCFANNCKKWTLEDEKSRKSLKNNALSQQKRVDCNCLQIDPHGEDRIRTYSADPVKIRVCDVSESEASPKTSPSELKWRILEEFSALDDLDQRDLLRVLQSLLKAEFDEATL